MAIMFFCDRIINSEIGIEGIFIGAMFLCSVFEFFHVQDYFSVLANANLNCTREAPFNNFSAEQSQDSVYDARRVYTGGPDVIKAHGSDDQPSIDDVQVRLDQGKPVIDYYSSSDSEDKNENASVTEFDETVTPAVRATLREQKTNALTSEFLQKVMQFTERTDANVIKRTVIKFKNKLISNSAKKSNSASGTHESDNF
jgi:hypothetical protein